MKSWSQTKQGQIYNYLATAALTKGQIAIHDGTVIDAVKPAAGATAIYAGVVVSPNGAASGERSDIQSDGVVIVEAAGAITAGQTVVSNASGLAIAGTADYILGVAVETCGAPSGGNKSYVSVKLEIHKA